MKKLLPKLFLATLFFAMTQIVNAQDRYVAIVSQDGNLSFRVTLSDFYFYISQKGRITGFGSYVTGNISYDISGKVDRIGTTNISYDISGRMDRVGSTNISYDISGRVDRIGSINISYNISDKIDRFANKNISYNISDKVDRVGSANISYNISGNVDRISDYDGFIIFRPKTQADDE